ncbi:N/A [soil metagenome]
MTPSITIRPPTAKDADAIADLLSQLGYPATTSDVIARLARVELSCDALTLVADIDGRAVGVVTAHLFTSIHATSNVAWLTTLVVDHEHRHAGIGRQLVAAAEAWAALHGAPRISVSSGTHRDDAHAFYHSAGYEQTGIRLTRSLV